jgi:hypothetical protein
MRNRIIAGVAAVVAFLIGASMAGETTADIQQKVDLIAARERSPEQAQAEALARDHHLEKTAGFFGKSLADDLAKYALAAPKLETLKKPNVYVHLIDDPKILAPGSAFNSDYIRVAAKIEKVKYRRQGATVNAKHAVARVTNVSDVPVAYFLDVRSSDRGECKVRGTRMHNVMALGPGETADIAVCAGTGGVEILDLRALEVTPIGAIYLSKLPPAALGHDAVTARSHAPRRGVELCSQVPSVKLANLIKRGDVKWEDVADFYSRHNCEREQYVAGYRHAKEPLTELPWRPVAQEE